MNYWYRKNKNIYIYPFLLFLLISVLSCSSAKVIEGHWRRSSDSSDSPEIIITSKTITINSFYTTAYKVYEMGRNYIVLKVEARDFLKKGDSYLRFDLISNDTIKISGIVGKIIFNGEIWERVK